MATVNVSLRFRRPWIVILAQYIARLPCCGHLALWLAIVGGGYEIRIGKRWRPVQYAYQWKRGR